MNINKIINTKPDNRIKDRLTVVEYEAKRPKYYWYSNASIKDEKWEEHQHIIELRPYINSLLRIVKEKKWFNKEEIKNIETLLYSQDDETLDIGLELIRTKNEKHSKSK